MLLTGQPLHAFDLDRVAGARLTVRRAAEGEQVQTLDGQTRTLDGEMVVIEDAEGPTSIAGLMGGARSEVQDDTTRVLMEVATWNGPNIHRSLVGARPAQRGLLALREGARARAVHAGPGGRRAADDRAVRRAASPRARSTSAGYRPAPRSDPRCASARVRAILGVAVAPRAPGARSCEALDFARRQRAGRPARRRCRAVRRNDVTREIDLIEEVARIDGLERLPATLPGPPRSGRTLSHAQRVRRARRGRCCAGAGCTRSSAGASPTRRLLDRLRLPADHELRRVVRLENPLSEDQSRSCAPRCSARCSTPPATTSRRNGPDLAPVRVGHRLPRAPRTAPGPTNTTRSGCC